MCRAVCRASCVSESEDDTDESDQEDNNLAFSINMDDEDLSAGLQDVRTPFIRNKHARTQISDVLTHDTTRPTTHNR